MDIRNVISECAAGRKWGQRNVSLIRYIIIHRNECGHDGPSLAAYFRALDPSSGQRLGPPYHYVISKAGQIDQCLKDTDIGAHAAVPGYNFNRDSIGVCFIGDFRRHAPTPEQLRAAEWLIAYLTNSHNLTFDNVWGHDDLPGVKKYKECPGKFFPLEDLKNRLKTNPICSI